MLNILIKFSMSVIINIVNHFFKTCRTQIGNQILDEGSIMRWKGGYKSDFRNETTHL